jgi:UDP-2,3-diacylglucosamine pyrophosphatase LpxH
MNSDLLECDELHSISDLHLGGDPGFQAFGMTEELEGFINYLADKQIQGDGRRLVLVVNGDFIDFLAQEPPCYFDLYEATTKLRRITGDQSFSPVFQALRNFVAKPDRTLVINMGNHDLELSLPWVRNTLVDVLAGDDLGRCSRTVIAADGTGVRCRVGAANVLCLHGNEVDPANYCDYEKTRQIIHDLRRGRQIEQWVPNAGAQLVVDVMNDIKSVYPFVDLLKPSAVAVVAILLVLDPSYVARVPRLFRPAMRMVRGQVQARKALGLLEAEEQAENLPFAFDYEQRLSLASAMPGEATIEAFPLSLQDRRDRREKLAIDLLDFAEDRFLRGQDAMVLVDQAGALNQLGMYGAVVNFVRGNKIEALRQAFERLDRDRSFEVNTRDDTFRRLDKQIGPDIECIITGHTHLRRALRRACGRGYYFNTGTWARLIKLPSRVNNSENFRKMYHAFEKKSIEELDSEPGLICKQPTFVSIWKSGTSVRGVLCEYVHSRDPAVPERERFQRLHPTFDIC